MTIKQYQLKNDLYYEVYVNIRSKKNPQIRVQKRTKKIKTLSRARSIERSLVEKSIVEISKLENEDSSWGKIVTCWYEYKKNDQFEPISEITLSDYYSSLKIWTNEYWDRAVSDLGKAEIKNILANMALKGKSKSFQSKVKSNIHKVFDWAISHRKIQGINESPAIGIKVSKKEERDPSILSEHEVKILLKFAKELDSPWYPIWTVALLTGLRNGELYGLKWSDIDFDNKLIRVSRSYNKRSRTYSTTKGKYWRTIPINEDLNSMLEILKSKSTTEFVLPKLRDWSHGYQAKELKKFCLSIGIKPVTFHTLRSCFACEFYWNTPQKLYLKIPHA